MLAERLEPPTVGVRNTPDAPEAPRRPRRAQAVVWGLWAVLSAGLVGYVAWAANENTPFADDLELVPLYTGAQPFTPSWLWEPYNEHRLPLPRLVLGLGGVLTNHDYRTGAYCSVALLAAMTAGMLLTARRLRGFTTLTDAFFPLALLHWGQYETLVISYALNLAASAALGSAALFVIVRVRGVPTARQAILYALCLFALPLCGSSGVALVPALALWLAVGGVVRWRDGRPHARRDGALLLALAAAALAQVAVYLAGLRQVATPFKSPGIDASLRTFAQFLTNCLGPAAQSLWPASGVVVLLLGAATVWKLVRDWQDRPADRLRTEGMLLWGGALVSLGLGIGWGRAGLGETAGLATRYVTLAAPLLCLVYLAWVAVPGSRLTRNLPAVLCLLAVGLFVPSTCYGLYRGQMRRDRLAALRADVQKGRTPEELARDWGAVIFLPDSEGRVAEWFTLLRDAGQGPYRGLTVSPQNPPTRPRPEADPGAKPVDGSRDGG
jgi:hypothetical protein